MTMQAPVDPHDVFGQLIKIGQQVFDTYKQAGTPAAPGFDWPGEWARQLGLAAESQRDTLAQLGLLWKNSVMGGLPAIAQPEQRDKRFSDKAWRDQPFYDLLKQSYLLGSKYVHDFVEAADVDPKTKLQLRFYARQFTDAMSPANYAATNPEFLKTAVETKFESLKTGIESFLKDIGKGRMTITDEDAFEIGVNLAVTPGSVIFENDLMQLIEYAPRTAKVDATPLLVVPPCINKFYVFDLQPANSFILHAVEQGNRVFLISWRNATQKTAHLRWDDYIETGIFAAMDVVGKVTKAKTMNALGFCVGGTLLGTAAAVLAGRKDERLASITLLNTMLDFCDTGEIGIMVDEAYVAMREATIGRGGVLPGAELAFIFSTLRSNDLIWQYVVKNYLKGASPDAFDMLYWNADAVNLPGPMYCWYIRNAYLENNIKIPGKAELCGQPVHLSAIKAPLYALAAREDHIVLWQTAYVSTRLVGGDVRFVLGASGHIAGVINPVSRNKRSYWTNDGLKPTPEAWLDSATEVPGSWWPDWAAWLKSRSPATVAAPRQPGGKDFPVIEAAPGRYVKMKAV